jgi:5-bromo-4-chloroindolyl phosphate hydrolysis protein
MGPWELPFPSSNAVMTNSAKALVELKNIKTRITAKHEKTILGMKKTQAHISEVEASTKNVKAPRKAHRIVRSHHQTLTKMDGYLYAAGQNIKFAEEYLTAMGLWLLTWRWVGS